MLAFEFVFPLRSYARAATYSVGIRVGGTVMGVVSINTLIEMVNGIASLAVKLPPWAKALFLSGAVIVILHPRLRSHILTLLQEGGKNVALLWPKLQELLVLAQEKQLEADFSRAQAENILGS